MDELRSEDAVAFMDRWDDFHDAVVQAVEFDLAASKVTVVLKAQDKSADLAWSDVRLVVEDLSEYSFRQPPRHLVRYVFEAGVMWDDATVLLALDAPPEADAEAFRASDTYFGGKRLKYTVSVRT